MATKKTILGRIPTLAGAWDANYVNPRTLHNGYPLKKRVTYLGSEFQSLIEDNTYAPAALNEAGTAIVFDTEHWMVISNGSDAFLLEAQGGALLQRVQEAQEGLEDSITGKQNIISDLETIREGAAAGATALQEHQSLENYYTRGEVDVIALSKQDSISDLETIRSGATAGSTAYQKPSSGIPSSDMTPEVQASLSAADTAYQKPSGGIPNSDLSDAVQTSLGKADTALQEHQVLKTVNSQSILGEGNIAIEGIESDNELSSTSENSVQNKVIKAALDAKQDKINDLDTIRSGAEAGATAYQKPSTGIPANDLEDIVKAALSAAGTALQPGDITTLTQDVNTLKGLIAADDPAGAIDKFNEIVAFLEGLTGEDKMSAIIESIAAKYTKPSEGIPSSDLDSSVQTSLGKANNAYQKPQGGIPASDLADGVIPTIPGWSMQPSKPLYTLDEVADGETRKIPTAVSELTNDSGFTTNTGTVTGVKVGTTDYSPENGVVSLPDYPSTLPASDVYNWAKAATKPTYSYSEITDTPTIPTTLPASDVSAWAKEPSKPSYAYSEIGYEVSTATDNNQYADSIELDGTKPLQVITLTGNVTSVSFASGKLPPEGHSCHVLFTSSTATTITLAHVDTGAIRYICPGGTDPDDLEIPENGYVEVDFLRTPDTTDNDNTISWIYVRGI